ncbi:MAG: hypothetical protein HKN76_14680, partial [Saprospiraceae bacterium]|nr:hypothetical protein [Saprospiraceae bacterium]
MFQNHPYRVGLLRCASYLAIVMLIISDLQAQNPNEVFGYPYIFHYGPEQYRAHKQNWDVVQDDKGIMYFANGDGLLIYNGLNWDLVRMPGETMVQSLDRDSSGQIYLGAYGHFGKILFDSIGKLHYVDLSASLEDSIEITRVFATICLNGAVYFQTSEAVFCYQPNQPVKVWKKGPRSLGELFEIDGSLYLKEHYKGISRLEGDEWEMISGSQQFGPAFIHFMLPYSANQILLNGGDSLWLYDGNKFTYFSTDAQAYLSQHKIYSAFSLDEDGFLIGTVSGGIVHIDRKGKVQLIFDQAAKLNSLTIREFYRDANHDIWVALDIGLALLEYPAPTRIFNFNSGEIEFNGFTRFDGDLYVASDVGLWRLQQEKSKTYFKKVPGVNQKIWQIDTLGGYLLIATEYGLYAMTSNESRDLIVPGVVPGFKISELEPNRIYVYRSNGIFLLALTDHGWSKKEIMPDFTSRTRGVIEMSPTEIWLDTDWTELWKVEFDRPEDFFDWHNPRLVKIDSLQQLPAKRGSIYAINGHLYFVPTDLDSNYCWNEERKVFEPDTALSNVIDAGEYATVIWEVDDNKNCWFVTEYGSSQEHLGLSLWRGDRYSQVTANFDRVLNDIGISSSIEGNEIWFGGYGTVVHQRLDKSPDLATFQVLIDRIIIQEDSVISYSAWAQLRPEIDLKKNRIEFHFSGTDYTSTSAMSYQTFLEGVDPGWSDFGKENTKQYFGLNPGRYTFKVRGLNQENTVSNAATFNFSILRPWYLTWWAYALYSGGAISLLIGTAKWRNRELIREKEKLENVILEHTSELQARNNQLQVQ